MEKGAYLGATVGALTAVLPATDQLKDVNGEYEKRKTEINDLKAKLDCLALQIREKARKVDDEAKTMEDLKVWLGQSNFKKIWLHFV